MLQLSTGRNSERVKNLRREYAEWYGENRGAGHELVYTDETNFGVWTQRSNGRSKKGTKCHRLVSNSHGKNVMSGSSERGLVYWEKHHGSVTCGDCGRFRQYLTNLSNHLQSNSIVIIDNAPCHNRADDVASTTVKRLSPTAQCSTPSKRCSVASNTQLKQSFLKCVRRCSQQKSQDRKALR